MDLSGKNALITGGSMGLGKAMAKAFYGAGADVAILARRNDQLLEASTEIKSVSDRNGKIAAISCDVTQSDQILSAHAEVVDTLGSVDILVNNAAVNRAGYIPEADPADLDAMLAVNVRAPLVAMQAVAPHMVTAGGGRIVNVASWVARSPRPGFVAYSATKAALVALTRGAALEFADSGITVNAVCPGNVLTDIWESSVAGTSLADERDVATVYAESVAAQPIKRGVTPEEVAEAVLFLCAEASASITGEAIAVASGL